jgi:hypothetical protein
MDKAHPGSSKQVGFIPSRELDIEDHPAQFFDSCLIANVDLFIRLEAGCEVLYRNPHRHGLALGESVAVNRDVRLIHLSVSDAADGE